MSILKSDLTTKSLFITIVGKPNVGKSSLLNAIIGQKLAIVSHKPQTTRNKILGIFTDENIQLVFTDTPGIHVPNTHLGKYMVEEAEKSITGVDAFSRFSNTSVQLSRSSQAMAGCAPMQNGML